MDVISRLEQAVRVGKLVRPGQRAARLIRPGRFRDALHGKRLGHPIHPLLVQGAAGLAASAPAIAAGAVDWSEQHEQQMRVGVIHALANATAVGCYSASLLVRFRSASRGLRLAGLAALGAGGILGGHLSFRLAGGVNHAEAVPHLVEPGWHHLAVLDDPPEGKPVRLLLGEIPLVAVRAAGAVHVLANRCSHMSGPLPVGALADGCLTCPWHGSVFGLSGGSAVRGLPRHLSPRSSPAW